MWRGGKLKDQIKPQHDLRLPVFYPKIYMQNNLLCLYKWPGEKKNTQMSFMVASYTSLNPWHFIFVGITPLGLIRKWQVTVGTIGKGQEGNKE